MACIVPASLLLAACLAARGREDPTATATTPAKHSFPAALAAALFAAGAAHAAMVDLEFDGPVIGRTVNTQVTLPLGTHTYGLGQYKMVVDTSGDTVADGSLEAYCNEPYQFAPSSFKPYTIEPFSTFAAHTGYTRVLKLYQGGYADSLSSAVKAAAFQLAL